MADTDFAAAPGDDSSAASDVALMARVQAGDLAAFQELVERHQRRVIGTIAKMLGDADEAEDLAQQVFVRVWRSAARYRPEAKFTTWLFTITRNLVFNATRRRHRRIQTTPLGHDNPELPEREIADPNRQTPAADLLDRELQQAIQEAIDALPAVARMAVVLRRYEELPYEEIGAVLKISVPAVKSVLFRARVELKERLRKYLHPGP